MSGVPERKPYQQVEHGAWVLDIYDDEPVPEGRKHAPDMRVVLTRHGKVEREFTYPAYRIWTLLAHWTDGLDQAEDETPATPEECTCGEFADTSVRYADCPVHGQPATPDWRERAEYLEELAEALDDLVMSKGVALDEERLDWLTDWIADRLAAARREGADAERERFRRHALLNDDNLRDLHENAKAYSLANTALREVYGYTHSTTLEWLIRQGHIAPAQKVADAALAPVEAALDKSELGKSRFPTLRTIDRSLRSAIAQGRGRALLPKDEDCADGLANTCNHLSATGIDTTPANDPAKVWRCDYCGLRWRTGMDGKRTTVAEDEAGGGAEMDEDDLEALSRHHEPYTDDGVTYCGFPTDHGVIGGCGEVWPCSTVRAQGRDAAKGGAS